MSMYVLDTDHFSLHLRGHQQVHERLVLLAPDKVAITIITAEEHLRGRLAQVNKTSDGNARSVAYSYLHKAIIRSREAEHSRLQHCCGVNVPGTETATSPHWQPGFTDCRDHPCHPRLSRYT